MTETDEPTVTPQQRQKAAVAVLSLPILRRMGLEPGRVTRRRVEVAESLATLDGYPSVVEWARYAYRTRGVRST